MKWFNKDKTQMISLDGVDAYFYFPPTEDSEAVLTLFVHGAQIESRGDEATEVYNMLKNLKDVLHS